MGDGVDILEHLPRTADLISGVLEDTSHRILVHCAAGVSRSASIVVAYIMREEQTTYLDAVSSVRKIREIVQPNYGFTRQLDWYGRNGCASTLRDASSGLPYCKVPAFANLLRGYSASDVRDMVLQAGVDGNHCRDRMALQRALDALDRLQNAMPLDDEAREEKRKQAR